MSAPRGWPRVLPRHRRSRARLRPGGVAFRLFLTRHWQRTPVGPYVVTTAEVEVGKFETTASWGEGGPEIEAFGKDVTFRQPDARIAHDDMCRAAERATGIARSISLGGPTPAA